MCASRPSVCVFVHVCICMVVCELLRICVYQEGILHSCGPISYPLSSIIQSPHLRNHLFFTLFPSSTILLLLQKYFPTKILLLCVPPVLGKYLLFDWVLTTAFRDFTFLAPHVPTTWGNVDNFTDS